MGGAGCGDVGAMFDVSDTVPMHGLPPTLTLPRKGGGDTEAGALGLMGRDPSQAALGSRLRGNDGGEIGAPGTPTHSAARGAKND